MGYEFDFQSFAIPLPYLCFGIGHILRLSPDPFAIRPDPILTQPIVPPCLALQWQFRRKDHVVLRRPALTPIMGRKKLYLYRAVFTVFCAFIFRQTPNPYFYRFSNLTHQSSPDDNTIRVRQKSPFMKPGVTSLLIQLPKRLKGEAKSLSTS